MRLKTLLVLLTFLPVLVFSQTVIPVTAGDDNIDNAVFSASPGDIIELITDGGVYNEQFPIVIDKPLTIRAAAGLVNKPVITSDDRDHMIEVWEDFTLMGVILNGALGDSVTTKGIRTGDSSDVKWGYNLKIDNCELVNFWDEVKNDGHAIYANTDTQADTVVITNTFISHVWQEAIYFKNGKYAPGSVRNFRMEYSTIWDTGDEGIYVEDHDNDISTAGPTFFVNHVTIHNSTIVDKNIYPKYVDGAIVKNSIITQSDPANCTPVRIYGTNSVAEYLLFYNTKDYVSLKNGATVDHSKLLAGQKPYYEDAANGNFAVAAGSPAATFADDGTALGDTNNGTWDATAVTLWELVENNNWINLTKNAVTDGDTLMFVSDSGSYMTPNSGYLPSKELVLMSEPGLTYKPILSTEDPGYIFKVNANLKVISLDFDGLWAQNGDNGTYRIFRINKNFDRLEVENCDVYNVRGYGIRNDAQVVDTLIINNCRFWDYGNYPIRFKDLPGLVNYVKITNSSFWNVGSDHAIYLYDSGGPTEVSHCTFFNIDARGIYAKQDTNGVVIRDNIFMSCGEAGVKVYGSTPIVEYNDFWDNTEDIQSSDTTLTFPNNLFSDPMFKDTSAANTSLALATTSPCIGAASDGGNMGDPNWGTYDPTGIEEVRLAPEVFALDQNYPNPFNPSTTIKYALAMTGHVTLKIYNILGQEVTTLVDRVMREGYHSIEFNGSDLSTGIYYYKLSTNDKVLVRKMLLIK